MINNGSYRQQSKLIIIIIAKGNKQVRIIVIKNDFTYNGCNYSQ